MSVAIEVKRTLSPTVSKGFRLGCEDVEAMESYYVIPRGDAFPLNQQTEALGLLEMLSRLHESWRAA